MAGGHVSGAVGTGTDHPDLAFSVSGCDSACHRRDSDGDGVPYLAAGEPGAALVLWAVYCRCRRAGYCLYAERFTMGSRICSCVCDDTADTGPVCLPVAGYGGRIPCRRQREARRTCRRRIGDLLRRADPAGLYWAGGMAGGIAPCDYLYRYPAESGETVPFPGRYRLCGHGRSGAPAHLGGAVGVSGCDAGGDPAGDVSGPALSHGLADPG